VGLVQDVPESRVRRGVASGIYNAAGDLGNILGPSIGGLIAQATGVASVFVIGSVGSAAVFFLCVFLLSRLKRREQGRSLAS
jgi:predicted MFS family arabinose efflux permease